MANVIAELFRSGAQHIARGLIQFGKTVNDFLPRAQKAVGPSLMVTAADAGDFFNTVRQSYRVTEVMNRGFLPSVTDVPLVPGELSPLRFLEEGIATVPLSPFATAETPAKVNIPFHRESPTILGLEDFQREFQESLNRELAEFAGRYERISKALEEAIYKGDFNKAVELEIVITHIYRTR